MDFIGVMFCHLNIQDIYSWNMKIANFNSGIKLV